jgi:hypothetical protein
MDAFPALVIYLSLAALHSDPSLWQRFHADKNLIFIAADYKSPWQTAIWQALAASSDPRVVSLTAALASMCQMDIKEQPALSAVVDQIGTAGPVRWRARTDPGRTGPAGNGATAPDQGSPDWLKEAVQTRDAAFPGATQVPPVASPMSPPGTPPPRAPAQAPAPPGSPTPDWLGDYVPGGPAVPRHPGQRPGVPPRPASPPGTHAHPAQPAAAPPQRTPAAPAAPASPQHAHRHGIPQQPRTPQQIGLPSLPLGTSPAPPPRSTVRTTVLVVILTVFALVILTLAIVLAA